MAQMEFLLQENGTMIQAEGKNSFFMEKESFGPGQFFGASIGG